MHRGGKARDEVDAGLHHRRGVQVGRDRGRRGHGAGQPEVGGGDGGLGERTAENEHDRHGEVGGVGQVFGGGDSAERPRAGLAAEEGDTDQHGEAA